MLSSTDSGYAEPLNFCVGRSSSSRSSTDSCSCLYDKVEAPMAFWNRLTYELVSFNDAFAALVEYSPETLLADFHYTSLDRYGQLTPIALTNPGTMPWTFETGHRRPKRVLLTIVPLPEQILWLPREAPEVLMNPPAQSPPTRRALPAKPPVEALHQPGQRELIRVRTSTKRPWDEAVVKFSLKVPKAKEQL